MKILQVIDRLEVGGAEKVLVNLSNILDDNACEISVLCLLTKANLDSSLNRSISITYLKRSFKYNPIKLIKLYLILRNYDIIHVHCRQVLRYVGLLLFLPKFLRKFKIVFQDHYGKIEEDKTIGRLLKIQLNKVSAYIGVSNSLIKWYNKIFPNKKKYYLLANIVRVNDNFNKLIKKEKSTYELVMVGNFRPQKNYEYALRILSALPIKFSLTIIGKKVDEKYYKYILSLIEKNGLKDRLTIKTNINNVSNEIVKYDLALHTALSETGPLVAIEYLSVGLPFVMFNAGEVASQIQPELSEFILSKKDELLWKQRITHILRDRTIYKNKINSIFQQKFSEENYYQTCLAIYQNL